jgi:site-specific recombinase XerD
MVGEMTLKQGVEEYKDVYLAYRNYAERTREEYTNDLEDLVEYLKRVGVEFVKDVETRI